MTFGQAFVLSVILFIAVVATATLYLLKRKARSSTPHWRVRDGTTDRALDETDEGQLFKIVGVRDTCPDCGSKGFYRGPSGGMSTNIFCVNRNCRSGFNITWFDAQHGTCDRIHKGDIERYPKPDGGIPVQ